MKKIKIRKCSHRNAKYTFEVTINGQRRRFYFATLDLAQSKLGEIQAEIANQGQKLASLPMQLRLDALRGQQLLDPLGASIMDAVNFYLKQFDLRSNSVTVREAWEGNKTWSHWQGYKPFCAQRVAEREIKPRSFDTIYCWINRFLGDFGTELICDVDSLAIEKWLNELKRLDGKPAASASKNTARAYLNGFFTHAARMGWIKEDPIKNDKVRIRFDHEAKTKLPEIFQIQEIARLLEFAPVHLVPYIAIGAFCGIRRGELHRLYWEDIKWQDRKIYVRASIAKTAQERDVTMPDNLFEWLAPYYRLAHTKRAQSGLVINQSEDKTEHQLALLRKAVGIAKWPQNGLRHSFASYHLAVHRNRALTSAELGHRSATVVYKNYNHRRTEEQGKAYFMIRPGMIASPIKFIVLPKIA